MGAGTCHGCSTPHPDSCFRIGKAEKNGPKPWDCTCMETQKKRLATGFGLAQLQSAAMWGVTEPMEDTSLSLLLSMILICL